MQSGKKSSRLFEKLLLSWKNFFLSVGKCSTKAFSWSWKSLKAKLFPSCRVVCCNSLLVCANLFSYFRERTAGKNAMISMFSFFVNLLSAWNGKQTELVYFASSTEACYWIHLQANHDQSWLNRKFCLKLLFIKSSSNNVLWKLLKPLMLNEGNDI